MMAKNVYTYSLSEPLGATATAKADIDAGDGNLAIESLPGGQPMLVRGTLQYLENQGIPTHSVDMRNGLVTLTLKAGRNEQPRFRFPWAACNGAPSGRFNSTPPSCWTSPPTATAASPLEPGQHGHQPPGGHTGGATWKWFCQTTRRTLT